MLKRFNKSRNYTYYCNVILYFVAVSELRKPRHYVHFLNVLYYVYYFI